MPLCLSIKWVTWLNENDYAHAGSYKVLLHEAGLLKQVPLYVYFYVWIKPDGTESFWRDKGAAPELREYASFTPVTPLWAKELAIKLTRDKKMARALGYTQTKVLHRERVQVGSKKKGGKVEFKERKVWAPVDRDKVLPMHLRVKIMKVAARSALAREMIMDDPEAAGRIIRDAI